MPDGQPAEIWVNDDAGEVLVFVWGSDEAFEEGVDVPDVLDPFSWSLDASEAREVAWLLAVSAGVAAGVADATGEVCDTFSPDRPPRIEER